ncbi:MAG: hemerythrin domain-containing protein [Labilithrix sp.]|nr:hemerythrin domain-containing protein [Labilithrix sp.]
MATIVAPSAPAGEVERLMTQDHARLEGLLRAAQRSDGTIDGAAYALFRGGLLRHIAMEEKVLLPFAREKQGAPLAVAAELRADHGEIAKLLVRSPSAAIVAALEAILGRHNQIEEGPGGLYATCDALAGAEAARLVERLRAQPEVPQAKYYDGPLHRRGT